eukprot:1271209-Amphidinium_carterae.1
MAQKQRQRQQHMVHPWKRLHFHSCLAANNIRFVAAALIDKYEASALLASIASRHKRTATPYRRNEDTIGVHSITTRPRLNPTSATGAGSGRIPMDHIKL